MLKTYEYALFKLETDDNVTEDDIITILKESIDIGIDINRKCHNIFYRSIQFSEMRVINFFIENGFDINIDNREPLEEACYYNNIEAVKLFIQLGMKIDNDLTINFPRYANAENIIQILQILYENGFDLFYGNNMLLCKAIQISNLDIIKYLFKMGADCSLLNNLELCYIFGHNTSPIMLELLLEKGSDPNAIIRVNNTGYRFDFEMSLLEWCITLVKPDFCKTLFDFNVDVNLCKNIMEQNYKFMQIKKYSNHDIIRINRMIDIFHEHGYDISEIINCINK